MKESIRFYIRTISPLHIGCDEVYEPTGFILNENARQMVVFDPLSFISQMEDADKAEFSQICAKGTVASILEIYKFMQNRPAEGRMLDVCPDFIEHYRQTLSIPLQNQSEIQKNLNNFAIPRTAFRSVDQRPYIPGSAIKGALRTAYLNLMEREKKLSEKGKERNARNLEQRLMEYDGIPTDPFRMVKVSDFMPVGETRTRIVYGVNKKKKPTSRDAQGLPLIFEVVSPGSVFVGTISADLPLPGSGIRKPVSVERLLDSTTLFYTNEKVREEKELADIGADVGSGDGKSQDQENSFLARVGRHSGAESVTVEGHRDIFIMGKRGEKKKPLNHATTLWLASETRNPVSMNNLQPFGWVLLGEATTDQSKEFEVREKEWKDNKAKKQKKRQEEAEKQLELKRKAEGEAKKQELEAEERRKEKERKKAEFEAMSPEERDIVALGDPNITEQQVVETFNRIDSFLGENKKHAAIFLKTYWGNHGKWKKKDCSKKQWVKVQKIEEILRDYV